MAKIDKYAPGTFCWAELATANAAAAKHFYSQMFHWTPLDMPLGDGTTYTMLQVDGNTAAALYEQKIAPPYWMVYIAVADADEAAVKVPVLGGKVVAPPFDVFTAGRMAVIEDPQGAKFCLWQARDTPGIQHGGPLFAHCWSELMTPDPKSSAAFYSGLFGWKTKPEDVAGAEYVEWLNNGRSIGGMLPMIGPEWQGVPPNWMLYFSVPDCDRSAAQAAELGGTICVPPRDIPNVGRFSALMDPQGARFCIFQAAAHGETTAA